MWKFPLQHFNISECSLKYDHFLNHPQCTNPPYETKTINFLIPDWAATSSSDGGLEDAYLEYEVGGLVGEESRWKAWLGLNGTHLTLFNMLVRAENGMWNEFEVQLIDGDGRIFTTCE